MKHLSAGDKIDRLCTIIPGCFSILGGAIIMLSMILFKKLRTETFYLVGLQALSEMIFNLSILAFYNPPVHGNWECQFQGWTINYGIMASILFSGAIAGHMYFLIQKRSYKLTISGLCKLSIGIILLSGAIACVPFATHQYEDLGAQCWLAAQGEYGTSITWGIVMRFATHYGLIWSVCIYCAWCYITIFKYVQEMREALRSSVRSVSNERSDVEKTVYRLQYYPAILMFVWLGITACRIYSSIYPNRHLANWALGTAHAVLNLQGFLNCLVFCSYRTVWFSWFQYFGIKAPTKRFPQVDDPNIPRRSFGRQDYHGDREPSRFSRSASIINQYVSDRLRAFSFAFSGRAMPAGMHDDSGSRSSGLLSSNTLPRTTISPFAAKLTEESCDMNDAEGGKRSTTLSVKSGGADGVGQQEDSRSGHASPLLPSRSSSVSTKVSLQEMEEQRAGIDNGL